jgi:hypothetical protein
MSAVYDEDLGRYLTDEEMAEIQARSARNADRTLSAEEWRAIEEAEAKEVFGKDDPAELAEAEKSLQEKPLLSEDQAKRLADAQLGGKAEALPTLATKEEVDKFLDENVKAIQVHPMMVRAKFGYRKPFKKGVLCSQILPLFKKQVLEEVARLHVANGSPKMTTGQPFLVTMLMRESFLIGLNDSAHPEEWRGAAGFNEELPPEAAVEEAFGALEGWAEQAESKMDPDRSYGVEFYAKWVWAHGTDAMAEAQHTMVRDNPNAHCPACGTQDCEFGAVAVA